MKLLQVDHIAINALDIDESVAFYNKMFGFEKIKSADMGNCVLVSLRVTDYVFIELFDLKGDCRDETADEDRRGLRHIGFEVEDIYAWAKLLKEKNAKIKMDVTYLAPIEKYCMLIEDPNGVIIELSERGSFYS